MESDRGPRREPSSSSRTKLISVVVPALNEQDNLPMLYDRVRAVFDNLGPGYDFELVITDNHSTDATFEVARSLAAGDARVRVYRMARNFGYQRSIYTAYLLAHGEAAVQLDADLQDPPELIPQMIRAWDEDGCMVVYGVRSRRRGEGRFLTFLRRRFYAFIDMLSDDDLPRDAGDFRLIDRVVIEVLRRSYDAAPYIRGAIAATGFKQVGFEYERDDRTSGQSKFQWRHMIQLAVDGVLNHSIRPLQLATYVSIAIAVVAPLMIVGYLVGRLLLGQDWPAGFASLALLQIAAIFLNAVFLGIIGAYVGRIFRQSKQAPFVIIEAASNEGDGRSAFLAHHGFQHEPLIPYPAEDSFDL